jgi:hypothetical protein
MWGPIIGATIGAAGSLFGQDSAEDAAEKARRLPDWLKPYVKGAGDVPEYLSETPLINSNWMDYVMRLGQGDYGANWQPMTQDSPWFNPAQTFTPGAPDAQNPYGTLPPPQAPPQAPPQQQQMPSQQQMIQDARSQWLGRMLERNPAAGMAEGPYQDELRQLMNLYRGQ